MSAEKFSGKNVTVSTFYIYLYIFVWILYNIVTLYAILVFAVTFGTVHIYFGYGQVQKIFINNSNASKNSL